MASCVLQVQMPTDFGSNLGGRSSEALVSDWRPALPSPYPERFGIPELNPLMPNLSPTCSASSDANPKSSLSLLPCKPDPDSATFPMSCTNPFSVSNPSQSIYSSSSRSLVSADACPPVSKGNSCSAGYKSFASSQFFGSNNRLGLESPVLNVESESMPAAFMGQGSPSKISEPDHEVHIWTERERRKKMRGMFVTLHSMLPKVSAKADKSTIVDEAIVYIKSLEQDLQNLLKKRAQKMQAIGKYQNIAGQEGTANPELSPKATSIVTVGTENECFQSLCSPNIVFNVRGSDVFITICCFQRPNLLEKIFKFVILDYKLEVKNVQISDSSDTRRLFMIHARATEHSQLTESNLKLAIQDLTVSLALK